MTAMTSIARHYDQLDGPERFVAVLEAMARGDDAEDKRLDDACPRAAYVIDEPSYRTRMHMSFTTASLVCSSINRDLDVIRTLGVVQDITNLYEHYAVDGAEDAFYTGWRAAKTAEGQPIDDDDDLRLTPALEAELNDCA